MKKITVFLETGQDFTYNAYLKDNPLPFGLMGEGVSVEEAIEDFHESIEEMKAVFAVQERGFPEFKLEFKYDIQSFLSHYSKVFSIPALERHTGINQKQLHHYSSGLRNPRSAQKKEDRIRIR